MVDCTEKVFQFIKRYKIYIMVFWSEIAIVSCFWGLDLPNQTVFLFEPPAHSDSGYAYDEMNKYFPQFLFLDTEVILIQSNDVNQNNSVLNPTTNEIFQRLNDSIWNKVNPDYNVLLGLQSYYSTSNITDAVVPYHGHNISVQEVINMLMLKKYVSDNQDLMIVFIESSIDGVSTSKLKNYIDAIKDELAAINDEYPNYYLVLTGMMAIFQDSMKTIQDDITSKDIILMPIIFLFMIFMIGSWKLVCLPMLSLAMTIMISFGAFYPFAVWWLDVNPMAPSIIMFLSMALSIDYSMFLLSRFAQERKAGKSVEDSVRAMLQYSGHVVCLSGVVLIVCYQAIVLFPISGMETIGYAAGITIFFCILINISLTASAILQCPNFYGTLDTCPVCCVSCFYDMAACAKRQKNKQVPSESLLINETESKDSIMLEVSSTDSTVVQEVILEQVEEVEARKNNCYFRLTSYTTRYPYKCIVPLLIYALMMPAIYVLTDYSPSIDFTMNFPKEVHSVDAYFALIDSFNPGAMSPMYILVAAKEGNIWNQHYFDALCAIGNKLIDAGYENNTQMTSIGFAPDPNNKGALKCIRNESSIETYNALINDPSSIIGNYSNSTYYKVFISWWQSRVNSPQQTVSYILATPNFNPYTASALQNSEHYRDAINEIKNDEKYAKYVDIYLHNSLYWEIDSLHKTNKTMPAGLAIIIGIVFILIGCVFKSIFLPFRLFLCIVVPIVFVYGVLTGIYQHGWLSWTTWDSLHRTGGIYWIMPVITCTVLIGLALDYEIFLFSRVYEYRSKGYTTTASIILAVSTTGPIISAAGFVMCLAFGGLLLENITASNQMGVVFVFGVFVDTFIVRPLIVPAVLSFADTLNWYPTKMPIPTKDQFGPLLLP